MPHTAVITFGRFNPITIGHEKLVNKVKDFAASMEADPLVFLSHSQDSNKNPICYATKLMYARKAFGDCVQESDLRGIFPIMEYLNGKYDEIIVFVGSDRVFEFDTSLQKYNNDLYSFDEISVLSAGSRDPDSNDIDGVSGTKLREYAINNRVSKFENCLPLALKPHTNDIMQLVRKGMKYAN